MISTHLQPGMAHERFQIRELLGRRPRSEIYRALQPALGCEVALEVFHAGAPFDESFLEHFRGEAQRLASVRSPRIVRVFDAGLSDGRVWIATQLVPGGGLDAVLESSRSVTKRDLLRWTGHVAEALDRAHRRGLAHGDVSFANVVVDPHAGALLAGFGQAVALKEGRTRPEMRGRKDLSSGVEHDAADDVVAFAELVLEALSHATDGARLERDAIADLRASLDATVGRRDACSEFLAAVRAALEPSEADPTRAPPSANQGRIVTRAVIRLRQAQRALFLMLAVVVLTLLVLRCGR